MENKGLARDEVEATFIVRVRFEQNATWHGSLSWIEQKKTQNFRSTLEMLKLMDEALDSESKLRKIKKNIEVQADK